MSSPTAAGPRVAVLIVCYNGRDYLDDCLSSLRATREDGFALQVVVVDNASTDESLALIRSNFPAAEHPWLTVVESPSNLGFTGGNNLGWRHLRDQQPSLDYLCLLNQDTIVEKDWLGPLIAALEQTPEAGAAQPKILLHPRTDLINTAGNDSHYLGFGFTTGYLLPDGPEFDRSRTLAFPSGAAVLLRRTAIPDEGPFYEEMFLYLEDAELGWRLRCLGLTSVYVPESRVQHKYRFDDSFRNYYFLERNRWLLLLTCYRLRTLILLAPALLAMEGGQLYFSWRRGRFRDKLRSYRYFLAPGTWRQVLLRRRWLQRRRVRDDRFLTEPWIGHLDLRELDSPVVRYLASPLFTGYWALCRILIRW